MLYSFSFFFFFLLRPIASIAHKLFSACNLITRISHQAVIPLRVKRLPGYLLGYFYSGWWNLAGPVFPSLGLLGFGELLERCKYVVRSVACAKYTVLDVPICLSVCTQ